MPVDAARAKSLFLAASDLAGPGERAAYLERECGGDAELRGRVEALLRANDAAPLPPAEAGDGTSAHVPDRPGPTGDYGDPSARVGSILAGKYKLIEEIGEGGMGSVFMARQTEPVKRAVAVKVIKAGMDSKAVLTRFEAERQALAMMDHPNIAKVLDAGTTEGGRPFFVMELVKGVPVTQYCDERKLTPTERLELFVPVCHAIQHAHQKGIIHRDIKPSNVLIALYDDKPVPKVIDFGVAKATGGMLTEQTIETAFGGVVGTPQYMSPEQASLNNLDIDTRSDVYSLGVLLYELLTGSPPFARKELQKAGFLEILRVVREEEPPRPSNQLSTADALPSLSANRGTEPKKLTGLLRNELDWIVMKALEKDRARRYETANGFAADVNRYLSGEAVQAHPPSTAYCVKKFVRRNRGQVIAASLVFLALLAGVIGTTIGLVQAQRSAERERLAKLDAEDKQIKAEQAADAEKAAKEAETQAKLEADKKRQEAERNLAFAKKGNEILGSVFAGLDPKKNYATVGELSQALKDNLKKAVQELEGSAIGDPLVVAQMQYTLGKSLLTLGDPASAVIVLEKARDTSKAKLGPDHPLTLQCTNELAASYQAAGKTDLALPVFEELLRLTKARFGPDNPATYGIMSNLGWAYWGAGQFNKALPYFEATLPFMKAKYGPDHPDTLTTMNNLAHGYLDAGQLDKALPLLEETLKRRKVKLGPDHMDTLTSMNGLASGYRRAGQLDKALPLVEETFKLMKAKLGPEHPNTLVLMNNLASGYQDARQLDKAVPLFEGTFKQLKAALGSDHPKVLTSMSNLVRCYEEAGQWDKALPLLEEMLVLRKAKLGADHIDTRTTLNNLAQGYWQIRQLDKSVPLFEELLSVEQKLLGRTHQNTQMTVGNLGVNYKDSGRVAEAVPLLEEAYRWSKKHSTLGFTGPQLFDAYAKAGKPTEAQNLIDEILTDARNTLPKDGPQLAGALAQFGLNLLEMKGFAQAEPLLRESLAIREKTQPDAWTTFNTHSLLGGSLLGQKKYADPDLSGLLLKGYEGMKAREKTIPPQGAIRIPEALDRLIELYTATNKPDEVKKWQAERAKYPKVDPPREETK